MFCLASIIMLAAPLCAQSYWYSFENSMDGWAADAADTPGWNWYIAPSTDRATAGLWSQKMYMDNYNDATKIWIEKAFVVPAGRAYTVYLKWHFATRDFGMVNLFNIIASVGSRNPESMADFLSIGHTGTGYDYDRGYVWLLKFYSKEVTPASAAGDGNGVIWVGLGVWGTWETPRTYYLDNLHIDISPVTPGYQTVDIAGARALPDGTNVSILGVGALTSSTELPGRMYAEQANRAAGIAVETTDYPPAVARGAKLNLQGTLGTEGGERIVRYATIGQPQGTTPPPIYPLFAVNRDVGGEGFGAYTPGVEGGFGLNNVGLLVTTCGRVVDSASGWFAIDDGGRKTSCGKSAVKGLAVAFPPWTFGPPPPGSFVVVTGISGAFESGGLVYPIVRPRNSLDVAVLSP